MAIVKGGGTPVNSGERRTIAFLRDNLPRHYAILHNLDLSERPGTRPHDYDVIVIGEYGIYPIEVKDWHGVVYGNAQHKWILNESERRDNPVQSITNKARVLHSYLGRSGASYQIAEISGLVIIANDQATLKLASNVGDRVRRLGEAISFLTSPVPQPDRRPARGKGGQRRKLAARDIERLSANILGLLRKSPPRNRFGDYEVIERLRRKETSVDFLARHLRLKKRGMVRLRIYEFDRYMETPQRDAQQRLIMREMEALTTLQDHPNIIRAYDPFEWDGNKVCAPTEWISDGFTMRDQLDESGPVDLADLKSVVSQVCAGLAFAHANGVLHRGLSPDSILLSPTGLVKLIDFDYARVPELATLSGMEISLGDTPYAAPEQVADSLHADHQADIYALGVTLYEALTGHLPDIPDPAALSSLNSNVPTVMDTVVLKMMAEDPASRYQSMEEVSEVLVGVMTKNNP